MGACSTFVEKSFDVIETMRRQQGSAQMYAGQCFTKTEMQNLKLTRKWYHIGSLNRERSRMNWRLMIKRAIPVPMLNSVFLALPLLYRAKIVNYETNISADGIGDLLSQLDHILQLKGN